jgi:secreted trypsin-like serine protease
MKIVTLLSTVFTLINGQSRIVGGNEAAIGEHRYVSRLIACDKEDSSDCFWICGGNLIAPNAILTAAHCILHDWPIMWAVIGSHYSTPENDAAADGVKVKVIRAIRHPRYNDTSLTHDGALLILDNNITTIEPVQVSFDPVWPNTMTWARGWGSTSYGGAVSNVLLEVQLKTWSRGNARKAFAQLPPSEQTPDLVMDYTKLGAGGEKGKDSCQGDSGGPLTIEASGSAAKLVGLTSTGYGCGVEGLPGIYTRTQTLKSFITWRCKATTNNCTECNFASCK